MNHRIRTQMFGLIAMTLPLAACAQQPAPAAKDVAPIAANRSATPAPQLVAGLPDFTNLVEQVGPGVVNVETTITRKDAMARQQRSGPVVAAVAQCPMTIRCRNSSAASSVRISRCRVGHARGRVVRGRAMTTAVLPASRWAQASSFPPMAMC